MNKKLCLTKNIQSMSGLDQICCRFTEMRYLPFW